ncbi:patellin-6-like [Malania oleifera]|uniref:patellin-6-like n=1 Tax=Malania oleifera TaxID=397392 RepID=UPI0025AE2413|nr:patellin-6-like [Malania oleifera]
MVSSGLVLGHLVSEHGIEVDRAKVELISQLPIPKIVRDIRSFLGHVIFYRRFIQNFSSIAKPLCSLLQNETEFLWTDAYEQTFETLKKHLTIAPIIQPPRWDMSFEIMADASDFALGAILSQRVDNKPSIIYYANHTLNDAQKNCTTTKKELLAVVFAFEKFYSYLPDMFVSLSPLNDDFIDERLFCSVTRSLPPSIGRIPALPGLRFPASSLYGFRNSDWGRASLLYIALRSMASMGDGICTSAKCKETDREELETVRQNPEKDDHGNKACAEMKRSRKKVLMEFRCRMEDAILGNYLLGKPARNCLGKEQTKARDALKDISLWGVPLLPSKGHEGTDIVLLKFLKAKDYKVPEAFEMLQKTLIWRREFKTEGILDEDLGFDLKNVVYLNNTDKEGHPLCYNIYGAFRDRDVYKRAFGSEKRCEKFLRWRVQSMEKGVGKLSFKAGGVNSMVQITDLKNSPGPGMKEISAVRRRILLLLQDNYPELIYKNIIINVPFWYYTFHALLSRFISQRTKSKFILARPSKVTKTLLKFIEPENIPVQYGGLQREDDEEFSPADKVSELTIKACSVEIIEIPVAETGVTLVWDVAVVNQEVCYKDEFIPDDEGSYTILLQKKKKLSESFRNSFYIGEPGKIVITIENGTFKKKRVFFRSKSKPTVPMYVFFK